MDNFWDLVKFEYKKIWIKRSARIGLIIFVLIIIFSCFGTITGKEYVEGVPVRTHYDSMKMDRKFERALSGKEINLNLIMEASKAF